MSEMFEVAREDRLTKYALRGRQRQEGKKRRVMCLLARGSGHPLRIRGEKQEAYRSDGTSRVQDASVRV